MDNLYTEKISVSIDPRITADAGNIVAEIQKRRVPQIIAEAVDKEALDVLHFPLQNTFNRFLKRSFDVIFSLLIITFVLSWLIPILAILIKIDSKGPVFFLQRRNKHTDKLFTCIKLRTMLLNAQADLQPASINDSRITRFGHFLRNHGLDELPQFINVLLGDMSVIGPRPHMPSDNLKYERITGNYALRYKVKPGITGLAQALGYCGVVNSFKKSDRLIKMDTFYIRYWTPKLDRMIFFRTIYKTLGI
jgi:putative colanic acid biosysnthesis UDP-glucose lipid carrier transferase